MIYLELKSIRSVCTKETDSLSLSYYLVTSFYQTRPVYGIQIQSASPAGLIHCETISRISYSKSYTNHLIDCCIKHLVTPTDMFSSIDLLMNPII